MNDLRIFSHCPTITRTLPVARWAENDDPTERKRLVRMEKEFLFLLRTETQGRVLMNGYKLSCMGTYDDYASFLESIGACICDGRVFLDKYGISNPKASPVEYVAVTRLALKPVIAVESISDVQEYRADETQWKVCMPTEADRWEAFDWNRNPEEGEWTPQALSPITEFYRCEMIAWSSILGGTAEEAREKYLAALPCDMRAAIKRKAL